MGKGSKGVYHSWHKKVILYFVLFKLLLVVKYLGPWVHQGRDIKLMPVNSRVGMKSSF
jgi:hypothetical protein